MKSYRKKIGGASEEDTPVKLEFYLDMWWVTHNIFCWPQKVPKCAQKVTKSANNA